MTQHTIERLALGNPIGLGYLYNACTEKSCNVSLLKENPPPPNCIVTTEIPSTESDYVQIKSASDKYRALNVAAEMKVSLFSGLVSPKGSGKYFRDEKTSARSVTVSLIHKITTKHEFLGILNDNVRGSINLEALKHRGATHVVTGITWGGNLIVTAEHKNEENKDVEELSGKLEAELKKWAIQVEGSASGDMKDSRNSESSKFQLKIVGDVLMRGQLPQTIEGAMALVAELPSLVRTHNDGKGVPVRYELTSLEDLQSYFIFDAKINSLHTLEEHTIVRLMSIFDEISNAKQKLNDFCDDVDKFEDHLPDSSRSEIRELRQEVAVTEFEFRGQLQSLLIQVRSGQVVSTELEDLKKEYESGHFSPSSVLRKLRNDFSAVRIKIEHLQRFTALGIDIVPKQAQSLGNKLLEFKDKQVYVLFGESEAMAKNGKLWEDHISALRILVEDPYVAENSKFLYVDLDSAPHLRPELSTGEDRRILLQRFSKRGGKCVDEDAYKTFLEDRAVSYALSNKVNHTTRRHNNVAILELPCPKFFIGRDGESCGRQLHTWTCLICKNVIDWGFDGFFYCSCGKGPAKSYKFRCSNSEHEDEFYSFPADSLKDCLGKLRRIKELNIVILGETGVGKSTWINGILNYMTFSSLDEAVDPKSYLLYAIPMSFNMDNGNGEMVEVKVGEDKNEHHKKGTSATQSSLPYTLRNGNQLIRLIDTPGICDTRGIDQDKKNMENILGCLQKYEEIHGICILLLPNMARISAAFTFCIKEILAHLHKGASQNIVFCYTNSRGHMYRPAETSASLRVLLSDINKGIVLSHKTQYSMDNEAIRFLAAYKNEKVNFTPDFVELFAGSWTHSAKETARLFKHISELPPHATKQTTSLNQVRRMINDLGRPLGETAKNIEDNIRIAEGHKKKLETIDLRNAKLEKDLRIPVTILKTVELGHPRTVCGAPKCVTHYKGKHGQSHCVYTQVCHDNCCLKGVPTGSTNEQQLQGCAAMRYQSTNRAQCIHCGCSWRVHMHQTFDVELLDDFEEIPQIRVELNKEKNAKRTLEEAMVTTDSRINQLNEEKRIIAETSARFAVFLKRNAVCLFNDATADYLDWLIENEKTNDKIAAEQRAASLQALSGMKRTYEEQKKVLEEKLENAEKLQDIEGEISIEKIEEEIQRLYKLPINGRAIKNMMDEAAKAVRNSTYVSEIQLDAISKSQAKGNKGIQLDTISNGQVKGNKGIQLDAISIDRINWFEGVEPSAKPAPKKKFWFF